MAEQDSTVDFKGALELAVLDGPFFGRLEWLSFLYYLLCPCLLLSLLGFCKVAVLSLQNETSYSRPQK